jgi:hypothetical protein
MKKLLVAAVLVLTASTAGCESTAAFFLNAYTGPGPDRTDLNAETVIVRQVTTFDDIKAQNFYVDRVRYLEDAPNNINRVVQVTSREIAGPVRAMNLAVGERIRISTRYETNREAGGLGAFIPNWSFDRYAEYPVGFHALLSVERVAQ